MKEVAVGILTRGGLVLACQRKKSALYPFQWEFPGGKIEPGESPAQALIRELREELGITATPGKEFHTQEWDYGDHSYRVYYYIVGRFEGEPVNHVFETIKWVKPEELMGMEILEGNREVVRMLAETHVKSNTPLPLEGGGRGVSPKQLSIINNPGSIDH
jgi:8-oxo-dGTP diphosphatase